MDIQEHWVNPKWCRWRKEPEREAAPDEVKTRKCLQCNAEFQSVNGLRLCNGCKERRSFRGADAGSYHDGDYTIGEN